MVTLLTKTRIAKSRRQWRASVMTIRRRQGRGNPLRSKGSVVFLSPPFKRTGEVSVQLRPWEECTCRAFWKRQEGRTLPVVSEGKLKTTAQQGQLDKKRRSQVFNTSSANFALFINNQLRTTRLKATATALPGCSEDIQAGTLSLCCLQ